MGSRALAPKTVGFGKLAVANLDGLDGEAVERDLHGHGAGAKPCAAVVHTAPS